MIIMGGSYSKNTSSDITTILGNVVNKTEIFWSDPKDVALTSTPTSFTLNDIILPDLTIGTIVRAVAYLYIREIEDTSGSANAIDGATVVQVQKSGGSYISGVDITDNSLECRASSVGTGTVLCGDYDVKAQIDALNQTVQARLYNIAVDGDNLELHEVKWGILIQYTV